MSSHAIFKCIFPETQEMLEWLKPNTYTKCIKVSKQWFNYGNYSFAEFYIYDKNEWKLVKIIGKKN